MPANLEALRLGRARKAVEEAVRVELELAREHDQIDNAVQAAYAAYDETFAKASRTDKDEDWKRCERAMNVALNISRRKRALARHFGEES